ncbi:chromatin remodeling complex subunit [Hysterangium stoloniferum]|nr:chromatin remodeling complex subunit [Hysterangium stoloniferum]
MASTPISNNVLVIPINTATPAPSEPSSYDHLRGTDTPIVIDNGATTLRWGFATSATPNCQPNVITKYKERKTNRPLLLFGDGVEAESGAKAQARTPWENDVLLNFDALENALDYVFLNLGIDTETVSHPVIMSERLATPSHSRGLTSELMFEQYSVPSLTYCVDSLMSLYQNKHQGRRRAYSADGLVISLNTASTSVIPVLNGRGILSRAKRIPWSTSQAYEYLQKLIQVKYPSFPTRITGTHTSWIFQNVCEFSPDYTILLRSLRDPLQMRANERIIQFPFTAPIESEKTEEELARIAERRREQGRRLQEMAAKQREEKLLEQENHLDYLQVLKSSKTNSTDFMDRIKADGFYDEISLDEAIKKLETSVKRRRKKNLVENEEAATEEPLWPLADVPDDQLDEDGLKEKRRQKLMKAGYEARLKNRRGKEREKALKEEAARRENEEREHDLQGWTSKIRAEHEAAMEKLRERKRRKAALSDRKSATAQARMKTIASLASDTPTGKKRRKGNGEDNFGANDDDWSVYRKLNTGAASSDEEDDLAQLHTLEAKLLEHDPLFTEADTYSVLSTQRSALVEAYRPRYDEGNVAGQCRVHLSVERWRVCEPWFTPGMAGVDTAGLGEVIANILASFSDQEKVRLVGNVFLTGTPAQVPGLGERLHATLRPIIDPDAQVRITQASDVGLDAWRGMRAFANADKESLIKFSVSKREYEEWGGERIKRWWGGNWNWAV